MNNKEASCFGKAVAVLELMVSSGNVAYVLNESQKTAVRAIIAEAKAILSESDK